MDAWLSTLDSIFSFDVTGRLVLAGLAGAILGWERERLGKPAGLRTHMLVSLGSATIMLATIDFALSLHAEESALRLDPIRVTAGIIGGVGFLGAGTIIEARGDVRGITTAASIWLSAAVGTACGMGMYRVAFTSVVLAVIILMALRVFESRFFPDEPQKNSQGKKNN